ncbi:MAG: hypothetical protein H7Z20_06405 [Bdellovibrio sp.]|nr:hypothetical protein [Methylotenera sp.]
MIKQVNTSLFFAMSMLLLSPKLSLADENNWGYVYGADTLPKGQSELYLWATDRRHKENGVYNAQDYQLEYEHGITDSLQGSVYMLGSSHNIKGSAPLDKNGDHEYPDNNRSGLTGVKASLKWNLLSTYKDPIGLSLYIEPGYSNRFKISGEKQDEYSLEAKLIVQKNFLDDTLLWATNLSVEAERRKIKGTGQNWQDELEVEVTSGLSYRFAPNWWAGGEMRYHSEYPNWREEFNREHYAIFLGPNIHWGSEKYWATLTYMSNMVGAPHAADRIDHLAEHERREIRFKVGYNF